MPSEIKKPNQPWFAWNEKFSVSGWGECFTSQINFFLIFLTLSFQNNFNHAKIFILRLFKMVVSQSAPRLEQRSVIKLLVAEKCKSWDIYRRIPDVYRKACSGKKKVYIWAKHRIDTTSSSRKDCPRSGNSLTLR